MMAEDHEDKPALPPLKQFLNSVETARPTGTHYTTAKRVAKDRRAKPISAAQRRKCSESAKHPVARAMLDMHRAGTQFDGPNYVKCGKEGCRQPAVKNVGFCRHHGGRKEILARRKNDPQWKPNLRYAVKDGLFKLIARGQLPMELYQQPIVRRVLEAAFIKVSVVKGMERQSQDYRDYVARSDTAKALMVAFISAWDTMQDTGDMRPWADAVLRAQQAGF